MALHLLRRPRGPRTELRGLLALALLALAALGFGPAPSKAASAPQARGVIVVEFDDQLNYGGLSLLRRAIERAKQEGTDLVVVLDTPGGEVGLMYQIGEALRRARDGGVQTVAFVDRRALSAGVLVAMSCDLIYMAPGSVIGAATPITIGPQGMQDVDKKIKAGMQAEWRAYAEEQGRPPLLAEAMVNADVEVLLIEEDGMERLVSGSEWDDLLEKEAEARLVRTIADSETLVALTAEEALEYGFADGLADDLRDVLEVKLGRIGVEPVVLEPTSSEDAAAWLTKAAPALLMAGVLLLLMELQAPGIGIPGALSALCFTLLLLGRYLTGLAGFEHILVIVVGLLLIAAEIFLVPGTLWAGVSGGLLLLGGLVWSQFGPGMPLADGIGRELFAEAVQSTILWTFLGMLGALALGRLLPKTAVGHRMAVSPTDKQASFGSAYGTSTSAGRAPRAGDRGRALTALRPVGKVVLDDFGGREFEASVLGTSVDSGTRVRVLQQSTGRLVVEPAPFVDEDPPAGA
jgi:membrane-bound serine protease (ClpP class)